MLRIQKDKNIFFKLTMANTISTITLLVLLFLTPVILIFADSCDYAGGRARPAALPPLVAFLPTKALMDKINGNYTQISIYMLLLNDHVFHFPSIIPSICFPVTIVFN